MKGSTEELESSPRVREFVNVHTYMGEEHARPMAYATASAVARVDELIDGGVLTEAQRRDAEWLLMAFASAGTPDGTARDDRVVQTAVRAVQPTEKRNLRKPTEGQKRAAVLDVVNSRVWHVGPGGTERMLRKIDPRFKGLTQVTFEHMRDRSVPRFAARLSCECGAFGDGPRGTGPTAKAEALARAQAAFEQASRESRRKPRKRQSR